MEPFFDNGFDDISGTVDQRAQRADPSAEGTGEYQGEQNHEKGRQQERDDLFCRKPDRCCHKRVPPEEDVDCVRNRVRTGIVGLPEKEQEQQQKTDLGKLPQSLGQYTDIHQNRLIKRF